jgi:hypothetical protein
VLFLPREFLSLSIVPSLSLIFSLTSSDRSYTTDVDLSASTIPLLSMEPLVLKGKGTSLFPNEGFAVETGFGGRPAGNCGSGGGLESSSSPSSGEDVA